MRATTVGMVHLIEGGSVDEATEQCLFHVEMSV